MVISGRKAARHSESEMIYVNPMGMGIEDLSVAAAVYEAALTNGAGSWLA